MHGPHGQVHAYIKRLALVLQHGSEPRRDPQLGPKLEQILSPAGAPKRQPRRDPYGAAAASSQEVPEPVWDEERQAYRINHESQATWLFRDAKISCAEMKKAKDGLKALQAKERDGTASESEVLVPTLR